MNELFYNLERIANISSNFVYNWTRQNIFCKDVILQYQKHREIITRKK